MTIRERAEKYVKEVGDLCDKQERHPDSEDLEGAYLAGFKEAIALAAEKAFEKIRCDDRTDRWQVANEVAAHIRALASETPPGACL